MVGYRNLKVEKGLTYDQLIRHSDGGVPERQLVCDWSATAAYQAFRWWGTGTADLIASNMRISLSGIPMVGYRNVTLTHMSDEVQLIRPSDGGVPERRKRCCRSELPAYQAFRWWGTGTHEGETKLHIRRNESLMLLSQMPKGVEHSVD